MHFVVVFYNENNSKWEIQIDFAVLATVKINFQNIYISFWLNQNMISGSAERKSNLTI